MDLRRQPVDVLLLRPSGSTGGDTVVSSKSETELEDESRDIMHRTCLRPDYTLSKQLMRSQGFRREKDYWKC
jgi:hypothetical protein